MGSSYPGCSGEEGLQGVGARPLGEPEILRLTGGAAVKCGGQELRGLFLCNEMYTW